ncbi:MAG: molybdate transport system substrate-binding protein [Acidobacteriaceae bacterium]|jgi:molybdate transport system substrate-binding protein|nr:molybdate transport system substrate-binding protein [Acidobacteriaceae bacterium]
MKCPCKQIVVLAVVLLTGSYARTQTVKVAAAADLKFAMTEWASQFEKQSGAKLDVTYGSSGNFLTQIQNGAPFDLFFSADSEYPKKLEAAGLTEPGTLREYAVGRIVIWTPSDSEINTSKDGWKSLLDQRVKKIAIANPEHAPYGRAALAALKKAGIYEQVKGKLVYGENISQAAEFVQSGNAQAGIVALSLALSPAMKDGSSWEVPAKLYPPIFQSVVVMKASKNKDAALKFLQFVKSEAGQEILLRFGFTIPIQASDILSLRLDDARRTMATLSYQR